MFTIKNEVNGEIIINKSKFITYIYKVNNILEVNEKLNEQLPIENIEIKYVVEDPTDFIPRWI